MTEDILKTLQEKDIHYVDLRFTDPRGQMHHLTLASSQIDGDMLEDGVMFDGSSLAGWKAIHDSDMALIPDLSTAVMDPFYQENTLALFCDVHEPATGQPYGRDPRGTAKKAEVYLKSSGAGETAYFGPEAEFFVFDDVGWSAEQHDTSYRFDSEEGPYNSKTPYEGGNKGYRPPKKGGYAPVSPIDSGQDLRSEMLSVMEELGLEPEKHHHEVAPSQHELGMKYAPLVTMADRLQLYKYSVRMVAAAYGKTASFMPKPVLHENGSGMHVHQSLWKDGRPVFAGEHYADLSETCLYYIGGILKHARALNAFTNASTNSYKRLVPGFEAPVVLAYSARNRSGSIRIPYTPSPKAKRIEARFPDPAGNPYLAFTALLMAGLDGIENKIHPGDPMDKDLYGLPPQERQGLPALCRSLREACEELDKDRAFLKKGGVMNDDQIEAYLALKLEECERLETHPHPVEFDMYYTC